MEKRISITPEQFKQIWKGRKATMGDYFIVTTTGGPKDNHPQLVMWDTIEEARQFDESIKRTFKTKFFPQG